MGSVSWERDWNYYAALDTTMISIEARNILHTMRQLQFESRLCSLVPRPLPNVNTEWRKDWEILSCGDVMKFQADNNYTLKVLKDWRPEHL